MGKENENTARLRSYLRQYRRATERKHALERRLRSIRAELNSPPLGGGFGKVGVSGGTPSVGAADIAYRIDDIETRLREQITATTKALIQIMDVIEYLPQTDDRRTVLEKRYIDCLSWNKISAEMYRFRSGCAELERQALAALLEKKRVRAILDRWQDKEG